MHVGLFYFAAVANDDDDAYRVLLEGARFADTHGFRSVWTPERHFHEFGGLYPNPAVTAAAVAAITSNVRITAGSVVAPLHHPARIAEEWAVVDRISGGRAAVAFASGWHADDFVLRPESYEQRRGVTEQTIEDVRALWRGEAREFANGTGASVALRTFPRPRGEIPIWLTSAGSIETFELAGRLGANVLTHLLGQDPDDLRAKIERYRASFAEHHEGRRGEVALMAHTLVGTSGDEVRELVDAPFRAYLRSSIGLIARSSGAGLPAGFDISQLSPADVDFIVDRSFDRFYREAGLFGTVEDVADRMSALADLGVDEIGCLIDFGVATDRVLASLPQLDEVRARVADRTPIGASR